MSRCASIWAAMAVAIAAAPAIARKPPPCPPPGPQLFLSPMGEPFRAGPGQPYPVATWFARADADSDSRLSPAEMIADADRFFATLDTDHDGEIIPEEMSRYEREVAPEIRLYVAGRQTGPREERRSRGNKPEPYGAPLGAGRFAFLNLPQPVSAADDDLNRGVSREEFRKAAADRFRQIDRTSLGYLIIANLPLTPVQQLAANCTPPDPGRPPERPNRPRRP